jgi:hypothetical protein
MATRASTERQATANLLIAAACALWLAAQLLPAFTDPGHPVPDRSEYGWYATALGWLAPVYLGGAGVPLFAGWTANLWFAGAVVAGLRHHGRFRTLALAALATAVGGVVAVISMIHVAQVGLGSWLWLSAMVVISCSAAVARTGERG